MQGVNKASGKHPDADGDEDHKCDDCGKRDVTAHVYGDPVEQDRIEATDVKDGSYKLVVICQECGEEKVLDTIVIPAGTPARKADLASLFGEGSIVLIGLYVGIVFLAAAIIFTERKMKNGRKKEDNEHENDKDN